MSNGLLSTQNLNSVAVSNIRKDVIAIGMGRRLLADAFVSIFKKWKLERIRNLGKVCCILSLVQLRD